MSSEAHEHAHEPQKPNEARAPHEPHGSYEAHETHGSHGSPGMADAQAPHSPPAARHADPGVEAHAPAAAHAPKPADHFGRNVGITMAAVGMLLAFSSALVAGERTELIAAMVQQTNTAGQYQTVSTKHRILQAKLREMHARMPDPKELAETEAALVKLDEEAARAPGTVSASAVQLVRLEARSILETVTPGQADIDRFAWLVIKFDDQKEAAQEWSESFDETIEAHEVGAEHFEWGQILAELGIVSSSIAMLFRSRKIWLVAMLLALGAFAIVGWTWLDVKGKLEHSERKTTEASRKFVALSSEAADEAVDEALVKEIEAVCR